MPYQPPFTLTPRLIDLVSQISEALGRWAAAGAVISPRLRRENRIRSIHASLAIENNTLSLEQVSAIIEGKRVLGHPREIQEVHNALGAYDLLESLEAHSPKDFLKAHAALMMGLADDAGRFRTGGVAVYQGERVVHMAPPAERVPHLVTDLFAWLEKTDLHPLLASAAAHYEIEFIHPFSDGNGRMGRLWQTLLLSRWRPQLAFLPVETVVHSRQGEYYSALGLADQRADVAPFAEFMLGAILDSLVSAPQTDQASDQASDQVISLLCCFRGGREMTAKSLMECLNLRHRPTFRKNHLNPALALGLIEMTDATSPRSPVQRYRVTEKGHRIHLHPP